LSFLPRFKTSIAVSITIKTPRLLLRAPVPQDAETIARLLGDYDVAKMLATAPHPYARADADDFIAREAARRADGTAEIFSVEQGELIGMIGLAEIQAIQGERIATLGYWLGRPYWGRGLATEAVRALVRYGFEALRLAGLKSGYFKENVRSGRVLAKAGFRYAGEGARHSLARRGEVCHVDVVLTRAQWAEFEGSAGAERPVNSLAAPPPMVQLTRARTGIPCIDDKARPAAEARSGNGDD
jgi:RimJ/RimL family protein N-acetyltransferase